MEMKRAVVVVVTLVARNVTGGGQYRWPLPFVSFLASIRGRQIINELKEATSNGSLGWAADGINKEMWCEPQHGLCEARFDIEMIPSATTQLCHQVVETTQIKLFEKAAHRQLRHRSARHPIRETCPRIVGAKQEEVWRVSLIGMNDHATGVYRS